MTKELQTQLIGFLNALIAHGSEGEFDLEAARPIAVGYVKQLEDLEVP